jgi:uncharacterized phage-like protein YoqJ
VSFVIEKEKTCCFSGHRVIAPAHRAEMKNKLERQIQALEETGIHTFITGGARGFDTLSAEAVLERKKENPAIRLVLALPCENQTARWTKAEKAAYTSIREQADEVYILAKEYDSGCMMRRNRFMVDHSSACVFYLVKTRSGTYKTVEYAMEQDLRLYNILLEEYR